MQIAEKFKQMEIEKKKSRPSKRVYVGPTIRYHSMSMPLIQEVVPKKRAKLSDELNESGIAKIDDDDEYVLFGSTTNHFVIINPLLSYPNQ